MKLVFKFFLVVVIVVVVVIGVQVQEVKSLKDFLDQV